jgi:hypothetical protein
MRRSNSCQSLFWREHLAAGRCYVRMERARNCSGMADEYRNSGYGNSAQKSGNAAPSLSAVASRLFKEFLQRANRIIYVLRTHRLGAFWRPQGQQDRRPAGCRHPPRQVVAPRARGVTAGRSCFPALAMVCSLSALGAKRILASRRLYLKLAVIETCALEPRWDAVEAARSAGISVGARARKNCIDPVRSALLEFPGEARGD